MGNGQRHQSIRKDQLNNHMLIRELSESFYDPANDKYTQHQLSDTRRPVLTLRHLNKLKQMRNAKQLENLVRRDVLNMLYGTPEEGAGGPPGI